jgi:DNA polymerase-3 subunit beta
MKLKVNREDIAAGLQKVQSAISGRTTLPVLANILFDAREGALWLTATDLELTVRARVNAEVSKAGATTLPARRVSGIFRDLPGAEVEMDMGDRNSVAIRCGGARFRLNGISEEDFPPLPAFEGAKSYVLDQKLLKGMLQRSGYAASTDETRPVLNGVLLSFRDEKATVVATDGRRLALVEQEVEFPKDAEGDLVLPTKTVNELLRVLGDEGSVKIEATAAQVSFDAGASAVFSKLVDGSYPNYRQVIPAQCDVRVSIERELLLNAVRRVALLTSDQSNSVKLTFSKNRLEISASTPEVGEASETLPVKYTGKEINVSFNPEFLVDPLKNLVSDEVHFELTDDVSPGVLKTDEPFLYVLMPMRMS